MNKIYKRTFRGIDYIRLTDLPTELRGEIGNWLSDEVLIKIQTDEGVERDCIQVKDFIHWYENLFTPVTPVDDSPKGQAVKAQKKLHLILES